MSPTLEIQSRFQKLDPFSPTKRKTLINEPEGKAEKNIQRQHSQFSTNMDQFLLSNNLEETFLDQSPKKINNKTPLAKSECQAMT